MTQSPRAAIQSLNAVARSTLSERNAMTIENFGGFDTKPSNPKDAVGVRKWRYISTVPFTVMWEIGAAMLEGARKYGRHNYRVVGVRSSVYVDAAFGHIGQWWEGEDTDSDSGVSHITKAIASLVVLRDAMIQEKLEDDRPPRGNLNEVRKNLQIAVDGAFERHPVAVAAFTQVSSDEQLKMDFCPTLKKLTEEQQRYAEQRVVLRAANADWDDSYNDTAETVNEV